MRILLISLGLVSSILLLGKASAQTYEHARAVKIPVTNCRFVVSPKNTHRLRPLRRGELRITPTNIGQGKRNGLKFDLLGELNSSQINFKLKQLKKTVDHSMLYGSDEIREPGRFGVVAPVDTFVHFKTQYGGIHLSHSMVKLFREILLDAGQVVREYTECQVSAVDLRHIFSELHSSK